MFRAMNLRTRLLLYISAIVVVFCIIVGTSGFLMAKSELDDKGETLLRNAVRMTLLLIEEQNREVAAGHVTLAEAQERVKIQLSGPKRADGTRPYKSRVDLGDNGYFIIYSLEGVEVMHPTLEGQNVWRVTDKSDDGFLLVQDQIAKARQGGGYTEYTWNFPYSERLGPKVAYAELDPHWNWVVTATAYKSDFNRGADRILYVLLGACTLLVYFTGLASLRFVNRVTAPIKTLQAQMKLAEGGQYAPIVMPPRPDEIGDLVTGYNSMAEAIRRTLLELRHEEAKTRTLAYYDQLSGLPNRNLFRTTVTERLAEKPSQALMLLMDIKDYKLINSTLGTEYGDRIIALMGEVLMAQSLPEGAVARITGDEFGVWAEGWEAEQLEAFVEAVRSQVNEALRKWGMTRRFEFSVSCAPCDPGQDSFDSCYRKAAVAMNYAKRRPGGEVLHYSQDMTVALARQTRFREVLEQAVRNDEFQIHYQRKMDCSLNVTQGFEALARWHSPELGAVSPAQFIPEVDRANLTVPFGRLILEKVLDDYPLLRQLEGEHISVSVNISPLFFLDDDFVRYVLEAVSRRGVPPEALYLEITEDVFISDFKAIDARISALRAQGVRIALDDFGSGYSSLSYIQQIQLDELKVDRSLVTQLVSDQRVPAIFRAIMQIAETYELSVVAEGVETEAQLQAVLAAGCGLIQGYYCSVPCAIDAIQHQPAAGVQAL